MLRRCFPFKCGKFVENLFCTKLYTQHPKVLFSSFERDLPNPSLPTPLKVNKHDTDILLSQIKRAPTLDKILELTSNHLDVMNIQHMVSSLEKVHSQLKDENIEQNALLDNQCFQSLCSKIMRVIRHTTTDELITVFKVLNNIGVRNNTHIMQSVLKMIGGHLNDLSLSQLTFLNFLLSKQRHNSLVDGLKLAIPLVLQVQIEQQLDSDNMSEVVDSLQIACRSRLKPATIQKIVQTIVDKAKMISPLNAVTVIFSLLHLETPVDGYKELLNYSFEHVSRNIDVLDQKVLLPLLRVCRSHGFYHSKFFFTVSGKIISSKWNLEETWEATKHLKVLGFCQEELINHFTEVICKESESFITSEKYCPLACVEYLTMNGYRPDSLAEVLKLVCSVERKIAVISENPFLLLKFVSCLAMLGHFPNELVSKVLNEELLFATWSKSRKMGRKVEFEQNALSLLWSLELFDKQNSFSFPPAIVRNLNQVVSEQNVNHTFPLQKFIENGLGGSQFLQNGVLTQNGLFIDHVLGMRSGNYPVSLSSINSSIAHGNIFIDDISLPTDAKMVAVICAFKGDFCTDPEVLSGWMDLKVKCLLKKKLFPVVVNFSTWKELPDREKIPYLMREIKQVADTGDCERKDSMF